MQSVCSAFHCGLCSLDTEACLDDYVQVSFTISPRVRRIPAHDPDSLSIEDFYQRYRFTRDSRLPDGSLFVDALSQMTKARAYLEPHERRRFSLQLEEGDLAIYDARDGRVVSVRIRQGLPRPEGPLHLRLQVASAGLAPLELGPGPLEVEVENEAPNRAPLLLSLKPMALVELGEQMERAGQRLGGRFDRFLSGRRLLTSETFRRAFTSDTIRAADGIGVRDISILFTDLKGSTELYDRIGDLKAFALVNQHFEHLGRAITRNHGAIVKTIGDAVMASFESPAHAVQAAREMLSAIESFNEEQGEREISLKVGIHRGASIAVTLNERLDFFGQTVNIAARVQGLADADEIYVSEEVYQAPGVQALMAGLHLSPYRAQLKGVQRLVNVYRAAPAPRSSSPAWAK